MKRMSENRSNADVTPQQTQSQSTNAESQPAKKPKDEQQPCETQSAGIETSESEFCWKLSDVKPETYSHLFDIHGCIKSDAFTDELGNKWLFSIDVLQSPKKFPFELNIKLLSVSDETKKRQEELAGEKIRAQIFLFYGLKKTPPLKHADGRDFRLVKSFTFEKSQIFTFDFYKWPKDDGNLMFYFRIVIPTLEMAVAQKRGASDHRIRAHALTSKLFDKSLMCDFVIRCSDKRDLPCHRSILSAVSPVFRMYFESDTKEKLEGRVNLQDADGESIELLLKYIYKGELPENADYEAMIKLLYLSDKYLMEDLKEACEERLEEMISIDRIVRMLVDVEKYNTEKLKGQIVRFIAKNWKSVLEMDAWKALNETNLQLCYEVLKETSFKQ